MAKSEYRIFNIGYQGLIISRFLEILSENNIQTLVDIRYNPYSRNKDFNKKSLQKQLELNEIEYSHLQNLGAPEKLRAKLQSDHDYDSFFKDYQLHLDTQSATLNKLLIMLKYNNICFMCMEHDHNICHRKAVCSRLAEFFDTIKPLKIINL